MADVDLVKDLLQFVLPAQLSANLDLRSLQSSASTFVDENLREYFADAVFRCKTRDQDDEICITVLLEHKSAPESRTAFQILNYLSRAYQVQWQQNDYSPIIPVIIYQGKQSWDYQSIEDLVVSQGAGKFRSYVPAHDLIFVDLGQIDDETLQSLGNRFLASSLFVQKYSHDPDFLADKIRQIFAALDPTQSRNLTQPFLVYFFEIVELEDGELNEIVSDLSQGTKEIKSAIMTIYDRLIAKGEAKGIQKGIQKGKDEKQIDVVLNAHKKGLSADLIAEIVGLSIDEVKRMIKAHTGDGDKH